jgi:hypothetical protein
VHAGNETNAAGQQTEKDFLMYFFPFITVILYLQFFFSSVIFVSQLLW